MAGYCSGFTPAVRVGDALLTILKKLQEPECGYEQLWNGGPFRS